MKILIVALVFASAAAAQTTITVRQATAPVSSSPAASASSSGGSSAATSSSGATEPAVTGSGTSFAEISDGKKAKKAVVVPDSLQSSDSNAEPGLNAGINKMHIEANNAPQPTGLHFSDLADGTEPVSVAVRGFQMFCNNHTMQQDEAEVRQWVKANQNIVASSPSEMQRKQQYPQVRDQLIGLKFPKEWFDGGTGASPVQKSDAPASK